MSENEKAEPGSKDTADPAVKPGDGPEPMTEAEAQNVTDPRPPSQIVAEHGAREGAGAADGSLRAGERESAEAYRKDGVWGAPGSEVPEGGEVLPAPEGVRPESQRLAEAEVRGDGPDEMGTAEAEGTGTK